MSENCWIIGDVHGCLNTLKALLAQLPSDEPKVFTGDLIDRGPDSKGVLDLIIKEGHQCVLGNHELMLLGTLFPRDKRFGCRYESAELIWMNNGGRETLATYPNRDIDAEHVDWMRGLPSFLMLPFFDGQRQLFVSHSSYHKGLVDHPELLGEKEDLWAEHQSLLWNRRPTADIPELFCVFGHTPLAEAYLDSHCAGIDTGCVFHGRKGVVNGRLTALRFPSKELISQQCIDSN